MLLLVLIGTICAIGLAYLVKLIFSPASRFFPGPPSYGSLIGTLPSMFTAKHSFSTHRHLFLHDLHKEYGPRVQVTSIGKTILFLSDPEDVRSVFTTFKDVIDRPADGLRSIMPHGILGLPKKEPAWAIHRKVTAPMFSERFMKLYADEIVKQTVEKLVPAWHDAGTVNVSADLIRLTLDVIGVTGFGHDLNAFNDRDDNKFITSSHAIGEEVIFNVQWRELRHYMFWHTEKASEGRKPWDELIEKMKAEGAKNPVSEGKSMLSELLRVFQTGEITEEGLRDTMLSLLLAGHETTSHTLSHLSLLLARNPRVQTKLREEVRAALGGEPTASLAYEHIQKLTYAKWCVLETLRLYPTVTAIPRTTDAPIELRGQVLPAGSGVVANTYTIGLQPSIWGDDVYAFRPERHGERERSPYAQLYFGTGNRTCIGRRFALQEAMLIISVIVNEFDISEDFTRPPPPPPVNVITLQPDGSELWLRVSPLS